MKKILAIDDEPALLRMIDQVLSARGFQVLTASGGQEALRILYEHKPDLVLLDIIMPGLDGWQICSRIRDVSDVPVIMLSGKRYAEADIVRGLDYGADEYLVKPVGNQELVARVRAVLRRAELPSHQNKIEEKGYRDDYLVIDIPGRQVGVKGERVKLTPREFRLLVLLVENSGRVMTHRQILEKVWGWEYVDDVDYVRIYIAHLRRKLEPSPNLPRYLITEPGVGYFFQSPDLAA